MHTYSIQNNPRKRTTSLQGQKLGPKCVHYSEVPLYNLRRGKIMVDQISCIASYDIGTHLHVLVVSMRLTSSYLSYEAVWRYSYENIDFTA